MGMVVKGQDCLERYKSNTCLTFAHFEAIRSKFKLNISPKYQILDVSKYVRFIRKTKRAKTESLIGTL